MKNKIPWGSQRHGKPYPTSSNVRHDTWRESSKWWGLVPEPVSSGKTFTGMTHFDWDVYENSSGMRATIQGATIYYCSFYSLKNLSVKCEQVSATSYMMQNRTFILWIYRGWKTSKNELWVTVEIFHLLPVLLAIRGPYPVLKLAGLQEEKKKEKKKKKDISSEYEFLKTSSFSNLFQRTGFPLHAWNGNWWPWS